MKIGQFFHALKIPFQIPLTPEKILNRFVYVYVINASKLALIDSGVAGCEAQIFDTIRSLNRQPDQLSTICLTHSHPDHIGAARAIQQHTRCLIQASAEEKGWIEDVGLQKSQRPVPGFDILVGGSVDVDALLADGNIVDLGNVTLKIIKTPGHSKGSLSFLMENEGLLITGDVLLMPGQLPIFEDMDALLDSLKRFANISNLKCILSSWQDPDPEQSPYALIDASLEYLNVIRSSVLKHRSACQDALDLCQRVVSELNLPPEAVNPLVAKSLMSIK